MLFLNVATVSATSGWEGLQQVHIQTLMTRPADSLAISNVVIELDKPGTGGLDFSSTVTLHYKINQLVSHPDYLNRLEITFPEGFQYDPTSHGLTAWGMGLQ